MPVPARMAESADAAASKAVVRKDVRVQVPLRAHCFPSQIPKCGPRLTPVSQRRHALGATSTADVAPLTELDAPAARCSIGHATSAGPAGQGGAVRRRRSRRIRDRDLDDADAPGTIRFAGASSPVRTARSRYRSTSRTASWCAREYFDGSRAGGRIGRHTKGRRVRSRPGVR